MNQKTKRRKTMSKNEIEDIKKIIKEYLKDNLRLEARSRYLDEYSQADNYIDVYLGDEKIQEVPLYELDFRR
jgi:division protein CdvB (Snf7/Vps24/ESCRT-III family)